MQRKQNKWIADLLNLRITVPQIKDKPTNSIYKDNHKILIIWSRIHIMVNIKLTRFSGWLMTSSRLGWLYPKIFEHICRIWKFPQQSQVGRQHIFAFFTIITGCQGVCGGVGVGVGVQAEIINIDVGTITKCAWLQL